MTVWALASVAWVRELSRSFEGFPVSLFDEPEQSMPNH
jgi:hypothetical protein